MFGYVAERQRRRSRLSRAPRTPDFTEVLGREEGGAIQYVHAGPPFAGHGQDEDESTDIFLYPGEPIARLRRLYEFRNEVAVEGFLEERPFLIQVLFNAYKKIRQYFDPGSQLSLTVVADPEAQEERELFLFIQTGLHPRAAQTLLAELDREWWLDAILDAKGEMTIGLEYRRDDR